MSQSEVIDATTTTQPLRVVSVLSEGITHTVVLVQNQETQKYSVAKISNEERRDLLAHLEAEAAIHKELEHPKILKSEGFQENLVFEDGEGNQLVASGILMEYAPKGDLFDLLACFGQMPLLLARAYARQMVEAVAYLHEKGIAHQDVKLENFLLDSKYGVKLADFGFSRMTTEEHASTEQVGTTVYWAPEQHEQSEYNGLKVDVFSLGITLFMLVTGRIPFEKASKDDEYYVHFINEEEDKFWQMHEEEINPSSSRSFFKDEFKKLINGMLCYRSSERMTLKEVLNESWLHISSDMIEKSGGIVSEYLKKMSKVN